MGMAMDEPTPTLIPLKDQGHDQCGWRVWVGSCALYKQLSKVSNLFKALISLLGLGGLMFVQIILMSL